MNLPQAIALAFCVVTFGGTAVALYLSKRKMTDEKLWRTKKTILVHATTAPELLAKVVRWKLSDPRFTETEEKPGGREFHTRFRRDKWTLGVNVHVKVTPALNGSTLFIQCFPEWFSKLDLIEDFRTDLQAFAASACSTKILNPA